MSIQTPFFIFTPLSGAYPGPGPKKIGPARGETGS
jgi:hypothetical protein